MDETLRFLIPDGYSPESRAEFNAVNMTLAGQFLLCTLAAFAFARACGMQVSSGRDAT